jgi:hypothetical protein
VGNDEQKGSELMEITITQTLNGEEAVKYLISKYDWNIYVPDYNIINVIAYRQKRDDNDGGFVYCDYDSSVSISFEMSLANFDIIATLLSNDENGNEWTKHTWIEYDDWTGTYANEESIIWDAYNIDYRFREWFKQTIVDYPL